MFCYIKFYKPFEVLSQFTDPLSSRQTLKGFIKISKIYPVGRLDYRSEGLLLLSNDGPWIQRLSHPRFEHPKKYWVQLEGMVTTEAIDLLASTIVLPGIQTRLPQVKLLSEPTEITPRSKPVRHYHPTSWVEITIDEGKKHQIRRMTAAVGFPTLRLIRVAIGAITLDGLNPGEWRTLSDKEINLLHISN
jgi:23S rRNA pseudouridine2457 synthase